MPTMEQYTQRVMNGETLKDFTGEEQQEYLTLLGATVNKGGIARVAKPGETMIDKVRINVSEKGAVHFQGMPGTSGKYGLTLYPTTIGWLFTHKQEVTDWIDANEENGLMLEKAKVDKGVQ